MPRKSTSSISAGDTTTSAPSNVEGSAGATLDGDTSMLSLATDASETTKPKVNSKAAKEDTDSVGVDDLLLPRTLTSRLARGILPANTSIQKDALLALTKAATVFISYLAHNANELTSKKTVGPQDVLKAIQEVEMGGVMALGQVGSDGKVGGRLERELEVFETVVRGKRKGYREKVKARESGVSGVGERKGSRGGDGDGEEGEKREAKRARIDDDDDDDGEEDGQHGGGSGQQAVSGGRVAAMAPPPQQRQSHHHSTPPSHAPTTNGTIPHLPNDDALPDDDFEDEHDDNADEEGPDDLQTEDDEDDDDDQDDDEDENEGERQPDEDDLDGHGPDDQLRHDMNGGGDDEEDDGSGSGDGSD